MSRHNYYLPQTFIFHIHIFHEFERMKKTRQVNTATKYIIFTEIRSNDWLISIILYTFSGITLTNVIQMSHTQYNLFSSLTRSYVEWKQVFFLLTSSRSEVAHRSNWWNIFVIAEEFARQYIVKIWWINIELEQIGASELASAITITPFLHILHCIDMIGHNHDIDSSSSFDSTNKMTAMNRGSTLISNIIRSLQPYRVQQYDDVIWRNVKVIPINTDVMISSSCART